MYFYLEVESFISIVESNVVLRQLVKLYFLIKCIIGLMKPDSGTISVFNEDIISLSSDELDRIRMKIGFLFQSLKNIYQPFYF